MHIATVGSYPITLGWLLAFLILILAILGLLSIVPMTAATTFAMLGGLALARLI